MSEMHTQRQINAILARLVKLEGKVIKMTLDWAKLEADIAAEQTAIDGVVKLLETLSAEIRNLPTSDPATQAKIDGIASQLEAQTAALAAAVAANTPAV